ncbi:uncharacterized protein LOC132275051 isoform X2 [Cornus florida]|uniref:uncharacterized protein LOC132275051 isoform X2 n=1 Tax=Cornus florida TaxID=4283 RepID=UPI0028A0137C|nr:uncharacterized protein LOC132275051 isoform X2 [Cornus florida]
MEPTDLGLSLECSNQFIRTKLNNDSGAGVNASSSLNVTLVPSDPLSELVWSPHKGLGLKCADGRFSEKKLSLLWDVGTSNIVLSPPDKQIDEINLVTSQAANFYRSCRGSDDINLVSGSTDKHNTDEENPKTSDFLPPTTSDPITFGIEERETMAGDFNKVMMTDPDGKIEDLASGKRKLGFEVALASEVRTVKQSEALDNAVQNLTSAGSRSKELALIIKRESENKMKTHDSTDSSPLEKLDSTAESGLRFPTSKDDCGASEERFQWKNSVPLETSPLNSRVHFCRRKGKEKALSDGDANQKLSKEEDESDESVESCNSVGLFTAGKRPWSFEQLNFVGSKRVKKQIQESPASTSFVRQDSSFMNWISNMVKGLPKSTQDEAPSLALTLANPSHGHESLNQEIVACNKNTDLGSRNMGFQSLFQSLYCSNAKIVESRMSSGVYPKGDYKDPVLDEKTCNANISLTTCHGENNQFRKQFLLCGNGDGLATQPRIQFATIASSQETSKANLAEDRTSCDLLCVEAKDGIHPSDSSSSKCKTNSADPPSKGKAIHSIGYREDPLRSLWITRFSAKPLGSVLDLDHYDQRTRRALECSADCTRPTTQAQSCVDFPIDQKGSEANEYSTEDPAFAGTELQKYAPKTGAAFKRIHGFEGRQSTFKMNPILPSPKYKSSEVMASVFARRLDAFNHNIPSDVKDDAINTTSTCSYCGRSGHELRDCSEITQTELEDLLRNITSYDGTEESSCFCIRCFQHDHWAVSCPVSSSSKQNQPGASLVNHHTAKRVQLPQTAGVQVIWFGKKPQVDTGFNLNPKCSGKTPDSRFSNLKHITSSSGEKRLQENQNRIVCNFVNKQISDVPKRMFDAMRRLHLTRRDILKLLNSQVPLDLDGFFIRVRLGKWEEGLGGTGYYVAYITGLQRETSSHNSTNSIPVNVGGIHCTIESRYVSNQDFLEEELMAWLFTISRNGGRIPSEEELILKFEERKRLGF